MLCYWPAELGVNLVSISANSQTSRFDLASGLDEYGQDKSNKLQRAAMGKNISIPLRTVNSSRSRNTSDDKAGPESSSIKMVSVHS